MLRRDKFGDAARKQGKVNDDLDAILRLLLSEDRSQGILDEKALIRKYLNLLNGIIREQKDVQGRTAGGEDPKSLSGEQGSLAQRTGNLSKDIRENQEKARGNDKDGDKSEEGDDKGNDKATTRATASRRQERWQVAGGSRRQSAEVSATGSVQVRRQGRQQGARILPAKVTAKQAW